MCHIQRLDSERDTDAGGKRRESLPCILIRINTGGLSPLAAFFLGHGAYFPHILLVYDKAAFLSPLHKRAEVPAKARRDQCCVGPQIGGLRGCGGLL